MFDKNQTWTCEYISKIPKQSNDNDCGIFMIIYIEELISEGVKYIDSSFDVNQSRENLRFKIESILA